MSMIATGEISESVTHAAKRWIEVVDNTLKIIYFDSVDDYLEGIEKIIKNTPSL